MKYECSNGHIFDENEMITVKEDRGEFWGQPCSESMNACPYCKDTDIGEYNPCRHCIHSEVCGESSETITDCDNFWDEQDYKDLKKSEEMYHTLWMLPTDVYEKLLENFDDIQELFRKKGKVNDGK